MIKDDLLFLTPYEESIICLMKDKANHRVLIDNLLAIYEINGYEKCCDFYLLSDYQKCVFLESLDDNDFVYLLNRLIFYWHRFGLHNGNKSIRCIFHWFLINTYKNSSTQPTRKQRSRKVMALKSLKILEKDMIDTQSTRKMLWAVFFNYCDNDFLNIDGVSLRKMTHLFKRDFLLIKDVLKTFDIDDYREFLISYFKYFLEKYGMRSYYKLKKRVILFLFSMDLNKSEIKSELSKIIKAILYDSKFDELPYIRKPQDLDILFKDCLGVSLQDLQFGALNVQNIEEKYSFYFQYFPQFVSKKSSMKSGLEDWHLPFIKIYANIYLNIVKTIFPDFVNKAINIIILVHKALYKFCFDVLLSFHYLCYFIPDDVFNKDNPYCFSEDLCKTFIYGKIQNDHYRIPLINLKNGLSVFYDFNFNDFYQDKYLFDSIKKQMMVVELLENGKIDEYDSLMEYMQNNNDIEFYFAFDSEKYIPELGQFFIKKYKYHKNFLEQEHWFKHQGFREDLKEEIKKDKNFLPSLDLVSLLKEHMNTSYSFEDGTEIGNFFSQIIDFNDKKTRKYLCQNYYDSFDNYDGYSNHYNKYDVYNNHSSNFDLLHLWVALKLYDFNQKKSPKFNESEIEIINKLKSPIKLDYYFYLLKEEIPQIEYGL